MNDTGRAESITEDDRAARLEAVVARLSEQVAGLSEEVERLTREIRRHHPADEVPEEVAVVIAAAVAAYLGTRAKAKRVRVRRGSGWATQARSDIQHSHAAFGSR